MRPVRGVTPGTMIIFVLAALAACGTSTPPGPSATPSPGRSATSTGPASSSPAATAPAVTAPATPTAPAASVLSSQVSYAWHWPNDAANPARIQHSYPVPPLPQLIAISAGDHPASTGQRAYNRMSFTFRTAFPSSQSSSSPR